MKISRAIIDTLAVIVVCAALMYITWESSPTASALGENTPAVVPLAKHNILKSNHLYQIEDILANGNLVIPELQKQFKINDKRFESIAPAKLEQLKGFFVGKFIKITDKNQASLDLPAELYHPMCFSQSAFSQKSGECPVILNP